jgi:hypothetical protein
LSRLLSIFNAFSELSSLTLQAQKALKIKIREQYSSVMDCHPFDANPDPNFQNDTDPDPDPDPDPDWHQNNAEPDSNSSITHVQKSGTYFYV